MITQLEYKKALKIVLGYESQTKLVKYTAIEVFNLEEHFRSNAIKAIYNCYQDTFGTQKEKLSLKDIRKLEIKNLSRFRGFGQKAEEKLKELLEVNHKKQRTSSKVHHD